MYNIPIRTSDSKIWNCRDVVADICYAMSTNRPMRLNLCSEGPDFETLGLKTFLQDKAAFYQYDLNQIIITTANMCESEMQLKVEKKWPRHLQVNTLEYDCEHAKISSSKHFGLFIGRGNAPRLWLGAHLWMHHGDISHQINHLDFANEFYSANLGLESLVRDYAMTDLAGIVEYIAQCPINCQHIEIDKTQIKNPAQQLLDHDRDKFLDTYRTFFIEIVCESYFTGTTFFPTEKIWRPILLRTPFIVQGPKGFLSNLKTLGFKTFSNWWDEGYDQDPCFHSIREIVKLIDHVALLPQKELWKMYLDMQDVLEHNRRRFLELVPQQDPWIYDQ